MIDLLSEDVAAIKAALVAGPTPGPWSYGQYPGYCIDWVRTEHPDFQREGTHSNYVADGDFPAPEVCQTGNAHGQEGMKSCWPANARFIAACYPERMARLIDALENAAAPREAARPDEQDRREHHSTRHA